MISNKISNESQTNPILGVRNGAQAYSCVLVGAGGKELGAVMRGEVPEAVCAALYTSPPYDLSVPSLPVSRLSVNRTSALVRGGLDDERPRNFETRRHSIFFTPAGAPVHWRKESPSSHLNLYFDAKAFDDIDEKTRGFAHEEPLFNVQVPGIYQLADELVTELNHVGLLTPEAVDSLSRLLIVRLFRHMRRRSDGSPELTPQLLARVRDFVAENLAETILVPDLAAAVGMSPNRFAHVYSQQTGLSPHQYVIGQRLERAILLLRQANQSLADVAANCGFASQQHLTLCMSRRLGISPSRYRAKHKSPK